MPIVRSRTHSFELAEEGPDGSLFVTSRSRRRTGTVFVVFQVILLAGFIALSFGHRVGWLGNLICGLGASVTLLLTLFSLALRLRAWELRLDRVEQRVTFRERSPLRGWIECWTLGGGGGLGDRARPPGQLGGRYRPYERAPNGHR